MHVCFGFNLCACEDTTSLKFGGFVLLYIVLVKLCYLLFVYGFENLMKINWVSFNNWEYQVGIVIDGGWNFVSTLRLWLSFMSML